MYKCNECSWYSWLPKRQTCAMIVTWLEKWTLRNGSQWRPMSLSHNMPLFHTSITMPESSRSVSLEHSNIETLVVVIKCTQLWLSGRAFTPWAGGCGFEPRPCHTKDVIKMVPDASLLRAQHILIGLVYLSSQTSFKKWDGFYLGWAVESD